MTKNPRPFSVTLLALGVLTIATINLIRFALTLAQWQFLNEILLIPPLYLAISGLIWGLVWLPIAWGLWRGYGWVPRLTLLATLAYTLYYWLDRLLLSNNAGSNWRFAIVFNIILITIIYWLLSRRKAKAFFGVKHE